jgi:hypothetical protein
MGRIMKIGLVAALVFLLVTYIAVGLYLKGTIDGRLNTLEAQVALYSRKKNELSEERLSLEMVKRNLTAQLALETEKAKQRELLANLTKVAAEERQKYINDQQALLEQLRVAEQQKLDQLRLEQLAAQEAAARTVVNTVSKRTTRAS